MAERYTNLRDANHAGWTQVEDVTPQLDQTQGDYSEQLPGGGTFNVQQPEPQAEIDWTDRVGFEKQLFDNIGGNPFEIPSDGLGNYGEQQRKELFENIFRGVIAYKDRAYMLPEHRDYWNKELAKNRSIWAEKELQRKKDLTEQYKYAMNSFDKQADIELRKQAAASKAQAAVLKDQEKTAKKSEITTAEMAAHVKSMEQFVPVPEGEPMAGFLVATEYDKKNKEEIQTTLTADKVELINMRRKDAGKGILVPVPVEQELDLGFYDKFMAKIKDEPTSAEAQYFYELPPINGDNTKEIAATIKAIKSKANKDEITGQAMPGQAAIILKAYQDEINKTLDSAQKATLLKRLRPKQEAMAAQVAAQEVVAPEQEATPTEPVLAPEGIDTAQKVGETKISEGQRAGTTRNPRKKQPPAVGSPEYQYQRRKRNNGAAPKPSNPNINYVERR